MDEQNNLPQLPRGWVWTTLREIAARINPGFPSGKHNKEKRGVPHLRPMNVSAKGEIDLSNLKYVETIDYEPLLKGDVLFNNTNSPDLLGKTANITQDTYWAYSNHMTRIRLWEDFVDSAWIARYLHYLFKEGYFKQNCTHHVNQASINSGFLAERVKILLAPLPEQHRIVAKIEELFSDLDAGIAALQKTKAQLKRYRQAVLKAAVEGKLTAEWRAAHRGEIEPASALLEHIRAERAKNANGKTKTLPPVDAAELGELPEGWVWTRVGELFEISYGLSESLSKTEPNGEQDLPVIRIPNITEYGSLDLSKLKYFPLEKNKREKLLLKKGDVLFNWRNAPKWIGRSAVFEKEGDLVNASFLLKLRPVMKGYSRFVSLWLNHLRMTGYFLTRVANAVNQANFNATMTAQIEIPVPPLAEQQQIVAEVERRLSVADKIEKTVDASLKQAERLRQSILKRAFAGKLVPQDPSDEPAERLLERITVQRASSETRSKQQTLPFAAGSRARRRKK